MRGIQPRCLVYAPPPPHPFEICYFVCHSIGYKYMIAPSPPLEFVALCHSIGYKYIAPPAPSLPQIGVMPPLAIFQNESLEMFM